MDAFLCFAKKEAQHLRKLSCAVLQCCGELKWAQPFWKTFWCLGLEDAFASGVRVSN